AAARSVSAYHLRLVAHADLAHLDPRVKLRGQLAHQLTEIDARVRGEVEDEPRPVEDLLHAGQLHSQPALPDLEQRHAVRLTLALLLLQAGGEVLASGQPDDPLAGIGGRTPLFLERTDGWN